MKHESFYLTAEELGISEWERDALLALIGPLERCELDFDMRFNNPRHGGPFKRLAAVQIFGLSALFACGTACCIGGHVGLLRGLSARDTMIYVGYGVKDAGDRGHSDRLGELYFPHDCKRAWRAGGPQAACAIRNFLTTGSPRWAAVMDAREPKRMIERRAAPA